MLSFFNSASSIHSTTIDILYRMKNLYRDSDVNRVLSIRVCAWDHSFNGVFDSTIIKHKKSILKILNESILDTINYQEYQRLSAKEQDAIKAAIAENLYLNAKKYKSIYYMQSEQKQKSKPGLSFSTALTYFSFEKASAVNFPPGLFLNKDLVKKTIASCVTLYPHLLKIKEVDLSANDTYCRNL